MKSVWIAVATGCLLAVAGCSQPNLMAMRSDDVGSCGYSMGAGMMAGEGCGHFAWYGRHGMGPGLMGGYDMAGLDLTSEQRAKIAEIRTEFGRKQEELMARMQALCGRARAASIAMAHSMSRPRASPMTPCANRCSRTRWRRASASTAC